MADDEPVPVKIFSSPSAYADQDTELASRVAGIIRDNVLPSREAPYHEVKVKVRRDTYGEPRYLLAYLLRSDVYTAEIVRIDLDEQQNATDIVFDYADEDDDANDEDEDSEKYDDSAEFDEDGLPIVPENQEPDDESYGDYAVDFVVATPCDGIPTAVAAVNDIYNSARAAGLRVVKLIGSTATVARYKSYLASGVRGFVNIGHGNPNLIVLADGTLPHSWFSGVSGNPVSPAVVYFNSCQVFNNPLKSAVLASGARTFIGGIVNLLIGPSEEVCKCFWTSQFSSTKAMRTALKACEKDKYPSEGAHGIGGDIRRFDTLPMKLTHAMWTHGHSVQVEYPDRIAFDRRYGFFARLRGKPFTSNWVHFAIPTPVIVDGNRLRAGSVMLRFRTGPGASIGAVHVWDAEYRRIANHDGLNLTSLNRFAFRRFAVPMRPSVRYGIGVSVLLKFGDSANLPSNRLIADLSSAGCDFLLPR